MNKTQNTEGTRGFRQHRYREWTRDVSGRDLLQISSSTELKVNEKENVGNHRSIQEMSP